MIEGFLNVPFKIKSAFVSAFKSKFAPLIGSDMLKFSRIRRCRFSKDGADKKFLILPFTSKAFLRFDSFMSLVSPFIPFA